VVAVTNTGPPFDGPGGEGAVQEVVVEQETPVAGLPEPKSTVVAPVAVEKAVPVSVTVVPPVTKPEAGGIEEMVGDGI
jgi:hypothetical protein